MAEIFAADIDFHHELRKGDTFSVVYEALTADGEPVTWAVPTGRVLSAEFVNNGKAHHALWYADASGRGAYFGFDGQSKRRTFLASPMEFSRVTSGFAMRIHPILQTLRAHRGVDYGAPYGTAVRSVADGVVEFAGWQNGYGNVIRVQHGKERSTLYAHLSRIDVRKGEAIEQGQRIGAVGATGWATGPHLHFEFQIDGRHVDPLSIAKASDAADHRRRVTQPLRRAFEQRQGSAGLGRNPGRKPLAGRIAGRCRPSAMSLYIGLMSGTSLDGVDGVLAQLDGDASGRTAIKVVAHHQVSFPEDLRTRLLRLNGRGDDELHLAALAANTLGARLRRASSTPCCGNAA